MVEDSSHAFSYVYRSFEKVYNLNINSSEGILDG